jgi:undecaprenyl-diphosphatase
LNLLEAIILGIAQGIAEFLPISSSGHLILIPWWLGWDKPPLIYEVVVHLGTLMAVLMYFRRDLGLFLAGFAIIRKRRITTPDERLFLLLVVSTIPAAIVALIAEEFFLDLFHESGLVASMLLVTATILMVSERSTVGYKRLHQITLPDAIAVGMAQALAVVPGISRSGSTISAGLSRDMQREAAARYSFLMSMPIIAGAGLKIFFNVLSGGQQVDGNLLIALVAGFLTSATVGYASIAFLLNFIKRSPLYVFVAYCTAFGLVSLLAVWLRGG